MDLGLDGKRALVTGASAGLGLGCAQALAAEGVRVIMSSRNLDKLTAAADTVPGASVVVGDMGDPGSRAQMMEDAAALGDIDIVIANAGGPPRGDFASTDVDAYRDAVELNMISTIDLCKRFIPPMQSRGWGRVVAITSMSVREPIPTLILSNAARSGLTSFLKTTAREVAPDGVTVNTLQPGLHLTERLAAVFTDPAAAERRAAEVPARILGDPGDFGRVAAFMCSDHAKFLVGASIPLDGGTLNALQ